jgi:predicted MFS family arabinose efflux permease
MTPAEAMSPRSVTVSTTAFESRRALRFVLLIGVVSLFADLTYEGARSITGPFLASLGASGFLVAVVAGAGELLGYGLRIVSGRLSERTHEFWPITLAGYLVQMAAVPALALTQSWPAASVCILLERTGKAIRNPPRDVMLSHAARHIGYGWAFGVHEALDQMGALLGPLTVAVIVARRGSYQTAFAILVVPAILTYAVLLTARRLYPRTEELEARAPRLEPAGLPPIYWIYLAGAAIVAAGFADFQLIAYHAGRDRALDPLWIPLAYAIAMGVSGLGSLVCGRLFDRVGLVVLIPLTIVSAVFAPLVFLGGFWSVLIGCALWGLGMGVHESIVPAAVALMVRPERRPSAYGVFTGVYGLAWFAGSAVMGAIYDRSIIGVVIFCVVLQLIAVPVLWRVRRQMRAMAQV